MNSKAIRKQLLAAVAMVLVAAVALGSSTYAWFAAQNEVTADGMKLQAQGESGIVIKYAVESVKKWSTTASAIMNEGEGKLFPTSTTDLAKWYHALSKDQDDANAQQTADKAYTEVTATKSSYVLQKDFLIRSAAEGVSVDNVDLAVKSVSVTTTNDTQGSEKLNTAVRVGVLINGTKYIYAPLLDKGTEFTLVAKYDNSKEVTEKKTPTITDGVAQDVFALNGHSVPANDTGITASIFMWFEGEDPECKSSNITASLDELNVSVVFTTVPYVDPSPAP